MLKKFSVTAVLVCASSFALAGPNFTFATISGNDTGNIQGSGNHTYLQGSSEGVDLTITAWSSALHGGNSYCIDPGQTNADAYDRCVHQAELTRYGNSGLGTINYDESDDTPNHSIDNNNLDYDMVLLAFSEAVNIDTIYTGWNQQYQNGSYVSSGTAGASVMAFTGTNFDTANPFSTAETWADTLNSGWDIVNEDFSRNSTEKVSGKWLDVLPVNSVIGEVFSKYWLVGAANNVNRDTGNLTDHIKLAGVSFAKQPSTPNNNTPVNAPGTLGMFLACAAFAVYRRKKA